MISWSNHCVHMCSSSQIFPPKLQSAAWYHQSGVRPSWLKGWQWTERIFLDTLSKPWHRAWYCHPRRPLPHLCYRRCIRQQHFLSRRKPMGNRGNSQHQLLGLVCSAGFAAKTLGCNYQPLIKVEDVLFSNLCVPKYCPLTFNIIIIFVLLTLTVVFVCSSNYASHHTYNTSTTNQLSFAVVMPLCMIDRIFWYN